VEGYFCVPPTAHCWDRGLASNTAEEEPGPGWGRCLYTGPELLEPGNLFPYHSGLKSTSLLPSYSSSVLFPTLLRVSSSSARKPEQEVAVQNMEGWMYLFKVARQVRDRARTILTFDFKSRGISGVSKTWFSSRGRSCAHATQPLAGGVRALPSGRSPSGRETTL
jgi:hypothetical protein